MVEGKHGIYIAWNVFEDYATKGSLILKQTVHYALDRLLGEKKTLATSLPTQGVVTLQEQTMAGRWINHLLYASPVRRGERTEVIEDILPVYDVEVSVRLSREVRRVYLAPQMVDLDFVQKDGVVSYTVPRLECHQMVVLESDLGAAAGRFC
jgi:hypothetical protein